MPADIGGNPAGTAMRLSSISVRSAASASSWQRREAGQIGGAGDLRLRPCRAEEKIRIEADHRVAAAHRPAFHRFQQEGISPAAGELQERRDWGFEVGYEPGEDELWLAAPIARLEALKGRLYLHWTTTSLQLRLLCQLAIGRVVGPDGPAGHELAVVGRHQVILQRLRYLRPGSPWNRPRRRRRRAPSPCRP